MPDKPYFLVLKTNQPFANLALLIGLVKQDMMIIVSFCPSQRGGAGQASILLLPCNDIYDNLFIIHWARSMQWIEV